MTQNKHDNSPLPPDPTELAQTWAEITQRAATLVQEHAQRQMQRGMQPLAADELGLARAFMEMNAELLKNPGRLAQIQMEMVSDYYALWQHATQRMLGLPGNPVTEAHEKDKRFRDDQWEEHILFDFIKQSYLITARHIHNTVSSVEGLDEATQQKVEFFTRQYIDALSPSNFALTNPAVLRETVTSHGNNLLRGLNNLLRDIETGNGELRVRMTDTEAFELGKNVATTPGKVVFQNELIQLLQYAPRTEKVFKRPLLIVPPWINKFYILDLREKNSFIKWCVEQGHTVFVISWVNPDETLAGFGFEDYLHKGVLAAMDAVSEQTGERTVNAIGYCLGGTLLAIALAYLAEKRQRRVASATFLTTLLDFSEPGELGAFIDEEQVESVERRMQERGYLEGTEMARTFNMLRANDLVWSFVINNYLLGKDPFPFDLLYWNSDSTRLPAKMHSYYLRNMYLENRLIRPDGIVIDDVPIDLAKVRQPSYFVSAIDDHIAPWQSTYSGARHIGGPVRFVLGGSGHIAGIVNPPAANKYCHWVSGSDTLPEDVEQWLQQAEQRGGSWWPDWQEWIAQHNSASRVDARDPENGKLKPIEDAPGSYVKFRLDKQPACPMPR